MTSASSFTGQPFGEAYLNGLLNNRGAVWNWGPPIEAVPPAAELGGRGLDMLARIQKAHCIEGRRVADHVVLVGLAADIGLPGVTFKPMLEKVAGPTVAKRIAASRDLLRRVGGQGFQICVFDAAGTSRHWTPARYFGGVARVTRRWWSA